MKTARALLLILLAGLLLAACGNKGDLVRPAPAGDSSGNGAAAA